MSQALVGSWEYTADQLALWRDGGVPHATQVRVSCAVVHVRIRCVPCAFCVSLRAVVLWMLLRLLKPRLRFDGEFASAPDPHQRQSCHLANAAPQMPLCYSPAIEYQLPAAPRLSPNASSTVLFPGISKPRREEILASLRAAGVHTRVSSPRVSTCRSKAAWACFLVPVLPQCLRSFQPPGSPDSHTGTRPPTSWGVPRSPSECTFPCFVACAS